MTTNTKILIFILLASWGLLIFTFILGNRAARQSQEVGVALQRYSEIVELKDRQLLLCQDVIDAIYEIYPEMWVRRVGE